MIPFYSVMKIQTSSINQNGVNLFWSSHSLKVYLGKSEVALVGNVKNIEVFADIHGCKIGSLPMTYLGMPLGASFKEKSVWLPIMEKMERQLSRWKKFYLSRGGCLMLLKNTLFSLPYLLPFPFYYSYFYTRGWEVKRAQLLIRFNGNWIVDTGQRIFPMNI